jgi:flavin reductase (DIM6/NTAB) family NADH-FMN oxidoreductase RutF
LGRGGAATCIGFTLREDYLLRTLAAMPGVTKEQFRAVMGAFASGVTIVTTADSGGSLWGITVSAFSSLSLDPPLCLVCIDKNAGSHAAVSDTKKFAVNILSDGQESLSNRFASRANDKFAGVEYIAGPTTGCPVFPQALAWMECRVTSILPGGDHDIFVGSLENVHVSGGKPLLYFAGAYGDITNRAKTW